MNVVETELPGVKIIEPRIFEDKRGFFLEVYNEARYHEAGIDIRWLQDNHSKSRKGTLRGLHYQVENAQDKLVWAVKGEAFDVAVDIRPGSATFGKWTGVVLSAEKKNQILVPKGFAHGFCVLSDECEIMYKCSDVYNREGEGGIIWNDPTIGIDWPISDPILSDKDAALPTLDKARMYP
ncbi:MAG: dTDP-4-dehydrorhamnose 3,5-epimerase [Deltaproteobacteria bacterium]|jgi:dTDP-4-dehydrorhamnose 3,5-epimerase